MCPDSVDIGMCNFDKYVDGRSSLWENELYHSVGTCVHFGQTEKMLHGGYMSVGIGTEMVLTSFDDDELLSVRYTERFALGEGHVLVEGGCECVVIRSWGS